METGVGDGVGAGEGAGGRLSWHSRPGQTVALDFDGVLHSYVSGWTGVVPTDPPVPGAAAFCRDLLAAGYKVAVVSTRCRNDGGVAAVADWLVKHGFPLGMFVTCEKVPAVAYVDDRAVYFDTAEALSASSITWLGVRATIDRLAAK